MSLTLYYHPLSSYCHKVLVALYENNVAFEPHFIDLGNAEHRQVLAKQWDLCKFPVLEDTAKKRSIPESSVIIEYLEQHFPGKRPLIPANAQAALDVRLWDRIMDNHFQSPMQDIVRNKIFNAGADMSSRVQALETAYRLTDRQLQGREWLTDAGFSMADCAAVPAMFYCSTLVPIPAELKNLQAYHERLLTRPSAARVLAEAKPWFHLYPFKDAIPQRFL